MTQVDTPFTPFQLQLGLAVGEFEATRRDSFHMALARLDALTQLMPGSSSLARSTSTSTSTSTYVGHPRATVRPSLTSGIPDNENRTSAECERLISTILDGGPYPKDEESARSRKRKREGDDEYAEFANGGQENAVPAYKQHA